MHNPKTVPLVNPSSRMNILYCTAAALMLLASFSEASAHSSKKERKKLMSRLEGALRIKEEGERLPPPYKIQIVTIDVIIDPTPRPSLFPVDTNREYLDPKRENKDYVMVGVFDRLPQKYHILAPLDDCGEPEIADYRDLYPGSDSPIGIKKVVPRTHSPEYYSSSSSDSSDSDDSSDSSSSSGSSSESSAAERARRRGRRAVSLGSDPAEAKRAKAKAKAKKLEIDRLMELGKAKELARASERAQERREARLREKERERKELEKHEKEEEKKKSKSKKSNDSSPKESPVQINRPYPPAQKKSKKLKEKERERESK